MDLQHMLNMMIDAMAEERSNYHLTLGELIAALSNEPQGKAIVADNGYTPDTFDSYRGYYADLAMEPGKASTCGEILVKAHASNGATFTGYKGGEFDMNENTPLWLAHGGCTGLAIVGFKSSDDEFTLITKDVDD